MTDLRQWRHDNEVSVAKLAAHFRVTPKTVYNWDNGTTAPPADLDERLAAYVHAVPQTFAAPTVPPETQFGQESAVSKEVGVWLKWSRRELRKMRDVPNYLPVVMDGAPNPSNAMWLAARGEFGPHGHRLPSGEWYNLPIGIYFDELGSYSGYEYLSLDHSVVEHKDADNFPRMKSGHFKPTYCIGNSEWNDL